MKFINALIIIIVSTLLYACAGSCDCVRELGCTILTAKDTKTDTTITQKTYCSTINFNTDKTLADSIQTFYEKYSSDTIIVIRWDSIYRKDQASTKTINDREPYINRGYDCLCAK
ncbi:MAG: hypothetical protein KF900_10735 [Bacteroidetes bacterium]|nr:hypothetical protein [Bacteroidota bacterium]